MAQEFRVPSFEIESRINRVQAELQAQDIDGLLVIQRADIFYFAGTAQNALIYIPVEGEPILMVRKYFPRAQKESPLRNIIEIGSITEAKDVIVDFYGMAPEVLGFELDVIPVNDFTFYKTLFPGQRCVDGSESIKKVRMIKSTWELEQMDQVAELSRQTFEYMKKNIRPGYSEMEFAGMFEAFARRLGHPGKLRVRDYQTEGYAWHVLSGKSGGMTGLLDSPASGQGSSSAFPCGGGSKKLAPDEPIMIDFGSALNGYHFDETRMFAITSMPQKAYDASLASIEIYSEILTMVKPGESSKKIFEASVTKAESLGYGEYYLGITDYKVSFIAHGVGIELIEPPFIASKTDIILEPGMVFAIEPKMVFEDEFTVGIENVVAVTDSGYRVISLTPVEVFICN
ncbi:M24 family metallopeptidase [Thermodesulfobacteriota bacterium]